MKESDIERIICTYAESKGFVQFKLGAMYNAGIPDRLFLFKGNAFFIEFKTQSGKVSKLQQNIINSIINNNISVYIVNSVDMGKQLIDNYFNEASEA
jgi:hypothetical protein